MSEKTVSQVLSEAKVSDYRLGLERAAHECEWMARGYVAHLMQPLLDAAERIRSLPDNPADEPHCERKDGRAPALNPSSDTRWIFRAIQNDMDNMQGRSADDRALRSGAMLRAALLIQAAALAKEQGR